MRFSAKTCILLSLVSILLSLTGCGSSGPVVAGNNSMAASLKAGELRLSKMNGMSKISAVVQGQMNSAKTFGNMSSATSFDLGTIKASQNYYFLLSNAGDIPVTDVVITSSNDSFVVSPNKIDQILPQKSNYIIPVIKVSVVHGVALNGTGYTDSLLPMGNTSCNLTITGKTKDQNDNSLDISIKVNLAVNAQIADVQLFDDANAIDLASTNRTFRFDIFNIREYINTKKPVLKNTGNIDITVTNYTAINDGFRSPQVIEQFVLKPNDVKEVSYPIFMTNTATNGITYNWKQIYLQFDTNNTITYFNKLQTQLDGKSYMTINNLIGDGITADPL